MQVNSMQDYVTRKKRQIVAATYSTRPPAQSRKTNSVHLSAMANNATQRERFVFPGSPAGATYTNFCTNCAASPGAPGTFQVTNTQGGLRVQDLNLAMSFKST